MSLSSAGSSRVRCKSLGGLTSTSPKGKFASTPADERATDITRFAAEWVTGNSLFKFDRVSPTPWLREKVVAVSLENWARALEDIFILYFIAATGEI